VKVSGGGRCNVTHACFDPAELINSYPRGKNELLEPFKRFGPSDTISWFESRGVPIVKEDDGRMFPKSNSSQSIIDCFEHECRELGIIIKRQVALKHFDYENEHWNLLLSNSEYVQGKKLMIATGSDKQIWDALLAM
jgi:predicted flavoprotein YhiN